MQPIRCSIIYKLESPHQPTCRNRRTGPKGSYLKFPIPVSFDAVKAKVSAHLGDRKGLDIRVYNGSNQAKNPSTALGQEAEVRVKWQWNR